MAGREDLQDLSFSREDFPWASPQSVATLSRRIWSRVDLSGPIPSYRPSLGSCWIWEGSAPNGYGQIQLSTTPCFGRRHAPLRVHRLTWMLANGPIPDELQIDHLCRVPRCVRPDHLEPVTSHVNSLRSDRATRQFCIRGHEYTEENTKRIINRLGNPGRKCRECERLRDRARYPARYQRQKEVRGGA